MAERTAKPRGLGPSSAIAATRRVQEAVARALEDLRTVLNFEQRREPAELIQAWAKRI